MNLPAGGANFEPADSIGPQSESLDFESLDLLLVGVMRDNRERVVGWLRDEPGSWGFLAGKAVMACREHSGRPLSDPERRLVWHRMWQILSQVRARPVE